MKLTTLVCLILCPLFIFGQDLPREKREKMEARKIGFLTTKLNLDAEEAKRFWPIYNAYSDEMKQIRQEKKERAREAKDRRDEITDAEVGELIQQRFEMEQQMLNVKRAYNEKFSKVISNKQLARLYRAEEEFKEELLRRIKQGRKDHRRK